MKLKNILALTASILMSLILTACGSDVNNQAKSVEVAAPKTMAAAPGFQK